MAEARDKMKYRGCEIYVCKSAPSETPYAWEDVLYGAESEDFFATLEDAKADVNRFFAPGPAPVECNQEIYA